MRELHQTASREEFERRRENVVSGVRNQKSEFRSVLQAPPFLETGQHTSRDNTLQIEATVMSETTPLESYTDPADVAAIMRQIRRKIEERQSRDTSGELDQALGLVNSGYNIYQPLSLPPAASLPGRAWDIFRMRLHHEVRSYLDAMIFKQTEFNSATVRALNNLARRSRYSASTSEVESLRDEIIVLREEIRRLREEMQGGGAV
ncbi:hypothetical protein HC891_20105 [Candidatus Gracilibacteria bacterium]|nr:hypothetical protein [Candidatus Gracilibacteria bacterium]